MRNLSLLRLALSAALSATLHLGLLAPPLPSQSRSKLQAQLRTMVRKAKSDTDALMQAANFAKEHELANDYRKLIQKILKIDRDHEGANLAMGRVKHKGKWMAQREANKLVAKELEATYKAKGLVRIDGVWVEKKHTADAKRGIFHAGDEIVSKWEKTQLMLGKARHPRTGRIMAASQLEKAKSGKFFIGPGGWVDEAKADEFHKDSRRPWMVRTRHCWVVGALPLAKLEKEIAPIVDATYARMQVIFGGNPPPPTRRPVVYAAAQTSEFKEIGSRAGGAGSAHGAFLVAPGARIRLEGLDVRHAVANWGDKNWGPYFIRHAAGLAISHAYCGEDTEGVPLWFHRGIGGYCERHFDAKTAKFFGQQQQKKGGVGNLKSWFGDFQISGDVEPTKIGFHIYQAGLLISYCMQGGDQKATAALQAVSKAFEAGDGDKVKAAVKKLQKVLARQSDGVQAYLEKLTQ